MKRCGWNTSTSLRSGQPDGALRGTGRRAVREHHHLGLVQILLCFHVDDLAQAALDGALGGLDLGLRLGPVGHALLPLREIREPLRELAGVGARGLALLGGTRGARDAIQLGQGHAVVGHLDALRGDKHGTFRPHPQLADAGRGLMAELVEDAAAVPADREETVEIRAERLDDLLFDWLSEVADAAANAGLVEPDFKRNLDIVQQDRDGATLRRWRLTDLGVGAGWLSWPDALTPV